ncbi:DNA helicase UvrD [Candidatus Kuenenbacteria bacterium]|nr:DNA helicase UvrD [Candidatus Kuenenbacteria bacterium]
MRIVADLHIHSRFSRACSRDLVLEKIDETCRIKGVNVVGTGDFTHPEWFREMKENLVEKEKGLYVLRGPHPDPLLGKEREREQTRFICSVEIACIYSKGGKCRRLHIVVLAPSLEVVETINSVLGKIGNLKSDGRPILGLDVEKLAEIVLEIDKRCAIIPAHIWTPWFAMFGSKSGFDSVEECWGKMADKIFAIETGLSSDPEMNWRVKNLDRMSIISNSDAHSLPNIGREANVLEIPPLSSPLSKGGTKEGLSYEEIIRIIKDKDPKEFLSTIEFYPEEGMYHFDGHRECGVSMTPGESRKNKNVCPKCRKELTIGVLNRVEDLADKKRKEGYVDKSRVPFVKLVELDKIIAEALGVKSRASKQVKLEYDKLIKKFGNEFDILLKEDLEKIKAESGAEISEGIKRMREGDIFIKPGFDGQYGEIKIFGQEKNIKKQMSLFL